MWLSVVFPSCPSCGNSSHQCYHRNCPKGGYKPMEINTDTSEVKCPSCGEHWHIKKSKYYCSCNHIFTAYEVEEEVDAIIANAKLIAKEIKRTQATKDRIHQITSSEIEKKTHNVIINSFGDKVWEVVRGFLPTIVAVVRKWLGI